MAANRKLLRLHMTVTIAEAIIGGRLGRASKMPCPTFGLSAFECPRGDALADVPGTVCSRCYARLMHYCSSSVRNAHARRLEALAHPQWSDAMAFLINAYAFHGYFRWFDSGDLQSVDHLAKIAEVCRQTPTVRHWLPTHEPFVVAHYLQRAGALPANLCLRISADYIEDRPTTPTHGLPTATVHRHKGAPVPDPRGSFECEASTRGNICGPCRACWDPDVANVSYPLK